MSGLPESSNKPDESGLDFDLDLDDLDDETLQRLLEEDPELEEELQAIEAAEQANAHADASDESDEDVDTDASADADVSAEDAELTAQIDEALDSVAEEEEAASSSPVDEGDDASFVAAPDHDDLADLSFQTPTPPPPPAVDTIEEGAAAEEDEDIQLSDVRPVPRINIHAFCLSDRVTHLIEQATADRRLAKAHVTLQSGDATRAAEIFSGEATPNLLILEAGDSTQALLSGLDELAQVCDPSTRVVVVGDINDIRLYRELMDRGISEYVVRPTSPLQIISTIGGLYADPDAPPIGKTFAFVGSRGGSGSSSVCHNVAWTLAQALKSDTVLMDLDLAFGTAGLDFEHDPSQGLAEALTAPERLDGVLLDRLLQKCTDRLSLFAAPNLLDRDYDLPTESFEAVIETVRAAAPTIAVDLPHVWTGWSRSLLQTADEIVLTATPDLSSFRNAKNIVETINAHRTNDALPILVLNQVNVPKRPEVPAEQFEEALGLEVRAVIPWDPVTFGTCATNAEPLMEVAPKSKPNQEILKIAQLLMGRETSAMQSSGFSLKSLFAKRG